MQVKNSENIFLADGGEMGRLVRDYSWEETILGAPETWPQSLKTSVNIVLGCSFPMLLWWGKELMQFYNDAFRPSLGTDGKHPESLGKPAFKYWTENWHIIKPLIDQVMDEGKSVFYENLPIPNFRNGRIEEVYWTFSYSPVLNEEGIPAAVLMTCMETTETVLSRKRLVKNEALLQSAIEIAELGIWSVDLVTDEMHLSEQHAAMFGLPEGSTFNDAVNCIVPQDKERILSLFNKAQKQSSGGLYDAVFTIKDASTSKMKIIHSVGQSLFDTDGKAIYISGSAQDITIQKNLQLTLESDVQQRTEELASAVEELRVTNEELEQSNTDLIESNEQLSQYAYIASHDLQEPLRKIQLFSNMLRDKDVDEPTKGLILKIIRSSERMRTLIKDLLDFSRLANPSQKSLVDLNTVIKNVIDDFELVVLEKKTIINIGPMPQVMAMPLQMNQLFYNLISNALKFTRKGVKPEITITCDIQTGNSDGNKKAGSQAAGSFYNITVTDNGIGIEEQYIKQVFDIFKRLHSTDIYPGSGIGLAICRRIVQNNGGQLLLESEIGQGSTFHVVLPVVTS